MDHRDFAKGAAWAAGGQLTKAVLNTSQGQVAVAATAAAVVATAPVIAMGLVLGAVTGGVAHGIFSFVNWLDS